MHVCLLDLLNLQLTTQHEIKDCCDFIFTEIWLNNSILEVAIQLAVLTAHCGDRIAALSTKTRGGGLCVYDCEMLIILPAERVYHCAHRHHVHST